MQGRPSNPAGFFVISICLWATLCTAQTISISGVVQDSAGVGIVGATVKLEKANLSTTSGAGGVFTLSGSAASANPFATGSAIAASTVQFRNGKIAFTLSGNTYVGISIHDPGGRQVFASNRTLGAGTHSIGVPMQTGGIFLCKVTIGHESYAFKASSFGASSTKQGVVTRGTSALAKQAKVMAVISDVIAATSPGMLNYRCVQYNSDTSGVLIRMIANAGDLTDIDGNVYQSVRIGNQVWTVGNLLTTKYNDGTLISHVPDNAAWHNLFITESTTGAYCYYSNDSIANAGKYGVLYNWHAVNTGKLAPAGWRVPTDAEWDTLQNHLIASGYNWGGTIIGNKIAKAMAAQTDWLSHTEPSTTGDDLSKNNGSGFSALPGGYRDYDGSFYDQSYYGYWWSATEYDASNACFRYLYYGSERLDWYYYYESCGYSIRLLRD